MKLIIDISEDLYNNMKSRFKYQNETDDNLSCFEKIGIAVKNGTPFEAQSNRCDSCTHSEEQDGSSCYECVKGVADNFEAQSTSDDEIIKALKAVRTFHNGNYAPQIDEAIRRLEAQPTHGSTYGGVSWGGTYKEEAQLCECTEHPCLGKLCRYYKQPCEDCISREAVIEHICEDKECYKEGCKGRTLKRCPDLQWVFDLPSVTPQRPKGKWIVHPKDVYLHLVCNKCLSCAPYDCETNYCPNCGAEMSGGGADADSD